jgi:hypothetical protein
MGKWKLFFVVLLVNLARTYGACNIEKEGKNITFKHCTTDVLKSYRVSKDSDDVSEIDGNDGNSFSKLVDGIFKKYPNLESLRLENCGISQISAGAFDGLVKLKILDLNNNDIKNSIDENVFKSLTNLEKLDLGDNAIENLDENLLRNNRQLKWLSLSSNKISWLDPYFFSHLKNLEALFLQFNQITTLDRETFEENIKLKKLFLSNNEIFEIERDTFKNLNELIKLDLEKNQCIDRQFEDLTRTTTDPTLKNCYKNYANLAREVRKLVNTKRRICLTNEGYTIIFGLILFLLLLTTSAVIYIIRKPMNVTTGQKLEEQQKDEPGVPFYCSRNILDSDPGTSNGSNTGKVYEFGYCPDGTVHVYNTVPKKSSETDES